MIRRGFTFLEILLVMAIIVIVAGISIPVIQAMLEDSRMTAAADMVRAKTAETRAMAMESGRPWRLAYLANTGIFQIAPDDSPDWDNLEQTPIDKAELFRDELPKKIVFAINAGDITSSGEGSAAGSEWVTIAVYAYDGSAREDTITYFGKAGSMPLAMDLRGLTGSVTMRSALEVKAAQP